MNRRAFVVAVLALCGCGRADEPKPAIPSPTSSPLAATSQPHIARITILYS